MIIFQAVLILVLIFVNAIFVMAEMALARVRRTRIDQLAEQKVKAAFAVQRHLDNPETFISACQLGITLATLLLGALGEASFAEHLADWVSARTSSVSNNAHLIVGARAFCYVFAFTSTAFLQTVLGELVPKTWTFQRAEKTILMVVPFMDFWCWMSSPLIKILNSATAMILKAARVEAPPRGHFVHTEEELKMLVSASHEEGVLQPEEEEMLHSVFDFSDTVASEIMTPRTDMICINANEPIKEFVNLALEHGHSRIPVFDEDMDSIFGLIHIRDGLRAMVEHKENLHVREMVRKVLIVPENKNLGDLLAEFKKTKTHVAIVVDEYGGTRGMVTFEDLLEELVGDIADEHEIVEEFVVENADGSYILDAKISLEEVNEKLNLEIEDEEFNTLGGHVFGLLGREPKPGDEVVKETFLLRVEESDRHRISKLRLIRIEPKAEGEESEDGKDENHNKDGKDLKDAKDGKVNLVNPQKPVVKSMEAKN